METNNQNKVGTGLPFYTLTFIVALLFELYWIFSRPYDYFMLFGIGIIIIITGYLTIDSILKIINHNATERAQQNETMIKAQKAIYLATKKNVVEAEKSREQNLKTLEVLMTSMVSSQKELVNVITTKSDELATKQIGMSDNSADVSELVDKLTKSNDKLAKQVQDAMTINELVKANAELVKNVQNMFSGAAPAMSTPTMSTPVTPVSTETPVEEPTFYEEPAPEEYNSIPVDNIAEMLSDEPIFKAEENEEFDDLTAALDDFNITDDTNVDTLGDIDINNINDFENDINAAKMEEAQTLEDMTVAEEISPELDNEMSAISPEKDPNAPLSEEEIAALFASL